MLIIAPVAPLAACTLGSDDYHSADSLGADDDEFEASQPRLLPCWWSPRYAGSSSLASTQRDGADLTSRKDVSAVDVEMLDAWEDLVDDSDVEVADASLLVPPFQPAGQFSRSRYSKPD
ncbi:hypothetical protein VTI74DRAFT_11443 [Chaetomium olivicolor]